MNFSDRIAIIYGGAIVREVDHKNVDIKEIGLMMAGSKHKIVNVLNWLLVYERRNLAYYS